MGACASLALSTLPPRTIVVGALLGVEPLAARKSAVLGIALLRVVAALGSGLSEAARGLTGRIDHDRRSTVHGVMQCPVTPVHPKVRLDFSWIALTHLRMVVGIWQEAV
jgi:hypothetical protein